MLRVLEVLVRKLNGHRHKRAIGRALARPMNLGLTYHSAGFLFEPLQTDRRESLANAVYRPAR